MTRGFQPNWASAPGDTIGDLLDRRKLSIASFSQSLGYNKNAVSSLLQGKIAITPEIAEKLSIVLGASKSFWLNREAQYRESLERLKKEGAYRDGVEWLQEIPVKDMVSFGWIPDTEAIADKIKSCLKFFNVPDVKSWRDNYQASLSAAAFRTSLTYESHMAAVCAWIRQGEIQAANIQCKPWNAKKFKDALISIRALTRKKNPAIFLPELKKLCAECGVAVVIVRAPKGCRASGVTKFISKDKALLQLSFRYRTDDHFWFTFFHEAGHLLLHNMHDKNAVFLENVDAISIQEETEANDFSAELLVPSTLHNEMAMLGGDYKLVMRFARKIGVSAGIVVGQLQHRAYLRQDQLNYLKTRYVWV